MFELSVCVLQGVTPQLEVFLTQLMPPIISPKVKLLIF